MNFKRALEDFKGDRELLLRIIRDFSNNLNKQIIAIQNAIIDKNFEAIEKEANNIKGGAANLFDDDLEQVASNLVTASSKKNIQDCIDCLQKLNEQINVFNSNILEL